MTGEEAKALIVDVLRRVRDAGFEINGHWDDEVMVLGASTDDVIVWNEAHTAGRVTRQPSERFSVTIYDLGVTP